MKPRSVRFRLTAWYAGFLAVTFALAGAGVWWGIRDSIHETVDKDLRLRLRETPLAAPNPKAVAEAMAMRYT